MKQIANEFSKPDAYKICAPGISNLEGRLGIKENIDLAGTANNLATTTPASGTSGVFGGFVNYLVTKNLNGVGPTWTLKHFIGPGKFVSLSDVNTDKIVYGIAFSDSATKQAQFTRAESKIQEITLNHLSTQLGLIRPAWATDRMKVGPFAVNLVLAFVAAGSLFEVLMPHSELRVQTV